MDVDSRSDWRPVVSQSTQGTLQTATGQVSAGIHPEVPELPVLVGPSTGTERNTIRTRLIPKACFKLEEDHFEFGSSFVVLDTFNVSPLKKLLDQLPGSKL